TTAPTTGDPSIGDGFYYMFVPGTGSQQFTAAKSLYTTATGTATVTAGATTPLNITMQAGQLSITPGSVSSTVAMGSSATENLTFKDTGQAPVNVKLFEKPGGFTMLDQPSGATGAPVQHVNGTFSPLSAAKGAKLAGGASKPAAQPYVAPWTTVANYPISVMDNAAATDPATGLVYSVGGVNSSGVTAAGYVYDPGSQQWTALPPMQNAREAPQAAFINGKLYVTGGWDSGGNPVATTEIYDPASGTWSTGASIPNAYAGASVTVLNGKMYVIGGCDIVSCGHADVQVYDAATDSWSAAASYPTPIAWQGCGEVNGEIYCAGGTTSPTADTNNAYVYDPVSDTWSSIAPIPIDLWGMGYASANGELLLSGGVTGGFNTLTNQGYAYDPSSGSWTALPNSNNIDYRGGSACGLYRIGGTLAGNYTPQDFAEQLPGYTACGTNATAPWMSASQTQFTLNPGQQATVTVTLNAGDPSVTEPGAYTAGLTVSDDTPYKTSPVNVTMNVTPPKTWGKITGTVTGLACSGTTGLLKGAAVQINGTTADYTLKTDSNGQFEYWIDKSDNPLTVIASQDGWQAQSTGDKIKAGATISANFTLSQDSC
ncbi:MAG: peptidase and in kexin sedolisin, partial [Actinomycetia bacterium]|nr:peptidase and in kexin sedolisin [Actinomycetes bacterium]